MNEQRYREIDLKWLLYRILRAWRNIVLFAIIIAFVAGGVRLALNLYHLSDPEYIDAEQENFRHEHASWVATGETLLAEIDNLSDKKLTQQEYNDNSILMKINPLREFNASMELYLDYDYQIMPDMTYQNIDMSDRILKSYNTYMTNGEFYQYILDHLSYDLELRYLKEFLTLSIDYGNNMISANLRHESAEACQELLNLVQDGLLAKQSDISSAISPHALIPTNTSIYETINLELEEMQKTNLKEVSEIDILIQEVNTEYLTWKKEAEPVLELSSRWAITDAIKTLIIAGILAGVLLAVLVACACILTGKLLNPMDMKTRYGLRIIALLPQQRHKKPFAFVSRWISSFGGIKSVPEDYDKLALMAGTSIRSDLTSKEDTATWTTIAFTGTVKEDEIQTLLDSLELKNCYTLINAPDILTNAESIEKVTDADCVVLVEAQEQTTLSDIVKELEALKAWNKPVLGTIITNTDAIM